MDERIKRDTEQMAERYAKLVAGVPNSMLEHLETEFIAFDREKGTLLQRIKMAQWMRNPGGVAHGGVTAAIIDNAMGTLSTAMSGGRTPTISMSINFIRGVPLDQDLYVEVICEKQGKQINFIRCRGYNESAPEKALFTSEGSFFNPGKNNF